MKKQKFELLVFAILVGVFVLADSHKVAAETNTTGKEITSGYCLKDFTLGDIPVGNFFPPHRLPLNIQNDKKTLAKGNGVTQFYNTSSEGYMGGGHNGLDMDSLAGEQNFPVFAVQPMLIVASQRDKHSGGWGESIAGATRVSQYSEEILTFHYHHLDVQSESDGYMPTRSFNACENVQTGDQLAMAGNTGGLQMHIHLHFTVRYWKNLQELKNAMAKKIAGGLYGFGYKNFAPKNIQNPLARHLDPLGMLTDSFKEVEGQKDVWYWKHIRYLRSIGAEFGEWDGSFGAAAALTRGEAARWLNVAMKLPMPAPDEFTATPIFPGDVSKENEYFPYIQQLTHYPVKNSDAKNTTSVVNPFVTCEPDKKSFCPDRTINRAEALKMNIMAFFGNEFIAFWHNTYPLILPEIQNGTLHQFSDVAVGEGGSWFAPYVYFGMTELNDKIIEANPDETQDFVAKKNAFLPGEPVNRAEFAKWIVLLHTAKFGEVSNSCTGINCGLHEYCSSDGSCLALGSCIPSEGVDCAKGGGNVSCVDNPECQAWEEQTQSCAEGIQTRFCTDTCWWGAWSPCTNGSDCIPGESENQMCNNGMGVQNRLCNSSGKWEPWSDCATGCECLSGICCDGCLYLDASSLCDSWSISQCEGSNAGQDAQQAQVHQYCSGITSACDGITMQEPWQISTDCSASEVCQMNNSMPECVASCQDTYMASSSQECYNNPQGTGNPLLCLEVQQTSGASWKYRVCKQGSSFANSFSYQLMDDNYQILYSTYNAMPGIVCTDWQTFTVSQISGYGFVNGAGLRAKLLSPSNCNQSICTYSTGSITIASQCL